MQNFSQQPAIDGFESTSSLVLPTQQTTTTVDTEELLRNQSPTQLNLQDQQLLQIQLLQLHQYLSLAATSPENEPLVFVPTDLIAAAYASLLNLPPPASPQVPAIHCDTQPSNSSPGVPRSPISATTRQSAFRPIRPKPQPQSQTQQGQQPSPPSSSLPRMPPEASNRGKKRAANSSATKQAENAIPSPHQTPAVSNKRRRTIRHPLRRHPPLSSNHQDLVVTTDALGRKSLHFPQPILNAVYSDDWAQVSNFLTKNKATIFPSNVSTDPTTRPNADRPAIQTSSDIEAMSSSTLMGIPSVAASAPDKLALLLSIPQEERDVIINNFDLCTSSNPSTFAPTSIHFSTAMADPFFALTACMLNNPFFPEVTLHSMIEDGTNNNAAYQMGNQDQRKPHACGEKEQRQQQEEEEEKEAVATDADLHECLAAEKNEEEADDNADVCAIWRGAIRRAKGKCYPIVSFPKLKLSNLAVMKVLLCWRYPEEARACDLLGSFRRVINNTCGNTCCINQRHCRIKGVFENGVWLINSKQH